MNAFSLHDYLVNNLYIILNSTSSFGGETFEYNDGCTIIPYEGEEYFMGPSMSACLSLGGM